MKDEKNRFPSEIRCLYFDDEQDERTMYAEAIERSWKELSSGVIINVETASTIEKALEMLKKAPEKYHVFVVDILVKKGRRKEEKGKDAIKYAHQDDNDLVIIALTWGDRIHESILKPMGCDLLVHKSELIDVPIDFFGQKILEALRKHNIEPSPAKADLVIENETDFPLIAVVDSIGRQNVMNLTERILDQHCTVIKPSYVRAGLSGASVLRISWKPESDPKSSKKGPTRDLLLKISKDEKTLKNEFKNDISTFPNGLFIPFIIKDDPVSSEDWYAIGSHFKDGASTLLDWLTSEAITEADIERTMKSLFQDADRGLIDVYKRPIRHEKDFPNIVLWKILNSQPYRMATIKLAIEEFKALIEDICNFGIFNQELIDIFLASKRVDNLDEEKFIHKGTSFCWSHGDLHGRNILVSTSGKAYLIDPANINQMHWASDIARLSVDLIVSGLDHGIESYQWNKMEEWCDFSSKFLRGETLRTNPHYQSNPNLCIALDWIRNNLDSIHNIENRNLKPEWEFRLALAVEFLRSAYRNQDLPAPKRVLGLLSACQALRETNTAHIDFQNNFGV